MELGEDGSVYKSILVRAVGQDVGGGDDVLGVNSQRGG